MSLQERQFQIQEWPVKFVQMYAKVSNSPQHTFQGCLNKVVRPVHLARKHMSESGYGHVTIRMIEYRNYLHHNAVY